MHHQALNRRQLLLAATVSAGRLLCSATASRAQSVGRQTPTRGAKAAMPLIPRRLLFADPDRSVVRISPDGRRIAFLAPVDGVLNLWVGPITDVKKARPFTWVTDRALGP